MKIKIKFQTNAQKSQFRDLGNGNWQILNVPITVDNAVMNGVLYEEAENAKGLNSYIGTVAVLRHPTDKNGGGMSALEGESLINHYAGGHVINAYNKDGINYVDIEIKAAIMNAQDNGEYYLNRLKEGESIGISTGLFFDDNSEKGITANGDKYFAKAINQQGDHIAFLPEGEDPAGGEDTFIKFNGKNDEKEFTVNIDAAVVAINEQLKDAEIEAQSETWLKRVMAQCKRALALKSNDCNNSDETNILNNTEVKTMRDQLIAGLKAKGVTVNADISDVDLLAAHNKSLEVAPATDNTEAITAAVNAAIAPLATELKDVKTQLSVNADKELDALAEQAAPFMDVEVADAKLMGTNALHKVLAKNGVTVGAPTAANSRSPEGKKAMINTKPWEKK